MQQGLRDFRAPGVSGAAHGITHGARITMRSVCSALVCALSPAMFCAPPSFAHPLAVAGSTVKATFDDTGEYQVHCLRTGWVLVGKLGDKPNTVTGRSGADRLGAWREVEARTGAEVATIRVYEKTPVVLFRDERTAAGTNVHVFPDFETLPAGLMELSYGVNTFAEHELGRLGAQGPWVLFDKERRVMVLA